MFLWYLVVVSSAFTGTFLAMRGSTEADGFKLRGTRRGLVVSEVTCFFMKWVLITPSSSGGDDKHNKYNRSLVFY